MPEEHVRRRRRGGRGRGHRGGNAAEGKAVVGGGSAQREITAKTLIAPVVAKALELAVQYHAAQIRQVDKTPYITHPVGVALILARAGQSDDVVAAGLLHDVLEDTPCQPRVLRREVGGVVATIVETVTEPDKRKHSWEERKAKYLEQLGKGSHEAMLVACADKVHNLTSLTAAYRTKGDKAWGHMERPVEQHLSQLRKVYQTVRTAWRDCPLLHPFVQELDRIEQMVRARGGRIRPLGAEGAVATAEGVGVEEGAAVSDVEGEGGRRRGRRGRGGSRGRGAETAVVPPVELPREVESKFIVRDPLVLSEVSTLRTVGTFTVTGQEHLVQHDTYLDTSDLSLARGRSVLKLRQRGDRYEVTFKQEVGASRGVSERVEVTLPVTPDQVPLLLAGRLPIEPVRLARRVAKRKELTEVIASVTDRTRMLLAHETERAEIDVDRVTYRRGRVEMAGRMEVEVENQGASLDGFRALVDALKVQFGEKMELSSVSKFEHGLRLMGYGVTLGH